ncbi:MAG: sugar ABC transporter permease [Acidimicrobiia bacterium]
METDVTDSAASATGGSRSIGTIIRSAEIDTRLLGMIGALIVLWIGFNIMSGGTFLTARNLWNLTVQTSVVAIMATGMVLIIVTRNIDLSVGSMLAAIGMAMALLQTEILPDIFGIGHPAIWIIALAAGIALGAAIGGLQGAVVAYVGVPSFIVTLGGLLVWRGLAWWMASGRTIAPMDRTFQLFGGGARGTIGGTWTWIIGIAGCVGIVALLVVRRRQKIKFGFEPRPMWAEIGIAVVACSVVLGATAVINSYPMPERLAMQYAEENGISWPPGGLTIPLGLATPVLITIVAALVMQFVATRTRYGRYVYAIGGNPEAAELAGVKTRWTIVKTFMLMGVLVAVAASIQIARLNAATSGMGQLSELYVIAAAVIGGTSLTGGVGTVPGAILGALVMQSLISGMVLMGVDAPLQDIVVGIVLVAAVALDAFYRRKAT